MYGLEQIRDALIVLSTHRDEQHNSLREDVSRTIVTFTKPAADLLKRHSDMVCQDVITFSEMAKFIGKHNYLIVFDTVLVEVILLQLEKLQSKMDRTLREMLFFKTNYQKVYARNVQLEEELAAMKKRIGELEELIDLN